MQKDFMAMAQGQGSEQEVTQKLMQLFQESGVTNLFQGPQKQQEFMTLVQSLVKAFMQKDSEAIQSHPLIQMLQQAIPGGKEWQQETQQQAGPTDFAAMAGGGMNAG